MASKSSAVTLRTLAYRSRRCNSCIGLASQAGSNLSRNFSTSSRPQNDQQGKPADPPRWSYTPSQMIAPVRIHPRDPRKAWEANSDPAKLDAMYNTFLGNGGDKMLDDEVKWLAVTHKSFDYGRRGFNDRLAYFGKRILTMQSTLTLLHSPKAKESRLPYADPYSREPFEHPDLDGLSNLPSLDMSEILNKSRLARLAGEYGIPDVVRWKPKNPANKKGSGSEVVYAMSLYAILGAVALQKGTEKANKIARERVLQRLGIS